MYVSEAINQNLYVDSSVGRTTVKRIRRFMPLMRATSPCAEDLSLSTDGLVTGLFTGVPLMRANSPCAEDLPLSTDGLVTGLFTGVPFQSLFLNSTYSGVQAEG